MTNEQESTGYQFRSPEYQVLGGKFFEEVCRRNGLEIQDAQVIDEILVDWLSALGNLERKVEIALEKIGDRPQREGILKAVLAINAAFLLESPTSQVGKFARKARQN